MKSRNSWRVAQLGLLALAVSSAALAQTSTAAKITKTEVFSGVISSYTPQGTTGPYEVRGPWSLTVKGATGKADFYAALNMELSDGWVLTLNNSNFDPMTRDRHTHHISFANATITWLANGFSVSGMATVTLNGSPAPISPTPLQVEVTGGSEVPFSNISLTFGSPGSKHFGSDPLVGVVRSIE